MAKANRTENSDNETISTIVQWEENAMRILDKGAAESSQKWNCKLLITNHNCPSLTYCTQIPPL